MRKKTVELDIDGQVIEMLAAIHLRMKELNWTQSDLAEATGQPAVSAYLSGDVLLGIDKVARMATALGRSWRLVSL